MPPIRQTPFFRGSGLAWVTGRIFNGCHRLKPFKKAEIPVKITSPRIEVNDDASSQITDAVALSNIPAEMNSTHTVDDISSNEVAAIPSSNIPIPSHEVIDPLASSDVFDMLAELDFELGYPDSFELSLATWTESERPRRFSPLVARCPITSSPGVTSLSMPDAYPHPTLLFSQDDYLQGNSSPNGTVGNLNGVSPLVPVTPLPSHLQRNDCSALGLPLPYPLSTAHQSLPKSTLTVSPGLDTFRIPAADSSSSLLSLHYDYLNDTPSPASHTPLPSDSLPLQRGDGSVLEPLPVPISDISSIHALRSGSTT